MQDILKEATWLNPPPEWELTREGLTVTTGEKTDFWQSTFYGFRRDDGHALLVPAPDEFTATLEFSGEYETLYDQAGLMLRVDPANWIKTGIELSDGVTNFSVVVTREGRSDWSVCAAPLVSGPQRIRTVMKNGAVIVHFINGAGDWQHLRLADFAAAGPARIGPTACSPQRAGFRCRFSAFELGAPLDKPLH